MTKRIRKKHRRAEAKKLANFIYDRVQLPGTALVTTGRAFFFSEFQATEVKKPSPLYSDNNPTFTMAYPEFEMRGIVDHVVIVSSRNHT